MSQCPKCLAQTVLARLSSTRLGAEYKVGFAETYLTHLADPGIPLEVCSKHSEQRKVG